MIIGMLQFKWNVPPILGIEPTYNMSLSADIGEEIMNLIEISTKLRNSYTDHP